MKQLSMEARFALAYFRREWEADSDEEVLERLLTEQQRHHDWGHSYIDFAAVNRWAADPHRKPAIHAFTAGIERSVALLIERAAQASRS